MHQRGLENSSEDGALEKVRRPYADYDGNFKFPQHLKDSFSRMIRQYAIDSDQQYLLWELAKKVYIEALAEHPRAEILNTEQGEFADNVVKTFEQALRQFDPQNPVDVTQLQRNSSWFRKDQRPKSREN